MAVLIQPANLDDTELLLGEILLVILKSEERAKFFVPSGQGSRYMARIRTMVTRKREKLRRNGKKPRQFTIRNTIHKETHEDRRVDCIVIWRQVSDSDWLNEQLEDIGL